MRLEVIESGETTAAVVDGSTGAVVDLLEDALRRVATEGARVVGVAVVVTMSDGCASTMYLDGGQPFALIGALEHAKIRINDEVR